MWTAKLFFKYPCENSDTMPVLSLLLWMCSYSKSRLRELNGVIMYAVTYQVLKRWTQPNFVPVPRHWFSGTKCGQFPGQFLRQRVPSTVHAAGHLDIMWSYPFCKKPCRMRTQCWFDLVFGHKSGKRVPVCTQFSLIVLSPLLCNRW